MSAFFKDCIENCQDVIGGGARYNMTGFQGCGLATAIDSFLAVKELIFEKQRIEISELTSAMIANFVGSESVRQMLLTEPSKYGRDDDTADIWAKRMVEAFYDEIALYTNARGGRFSPGLWSFTTSVGMGESAGASADGRLAGQALSHSMDPSSGQATVGPTAAIRSVLKLDHQRLTNGGAFLLEFMPSFVNDANARDKIQSLCETYLSEGGIEMQVSCSSLDELLAARKDPEKHRDLVVRVAGYSDYFVRLEPLIQDYIIQREKHLI
jgi:pyruvate-formate lyase